MPPKKRKSNNKRGRPKAVPPDDLIDDALRKTIIKTFNAALQKGNETLSISESKTTLKHLGIMEVKSDDIRSFFDKEELDESDFVHYAALKVIQTEKAQKAFDLIDVDDKGVVVLEDLQRLSSELEEDFTEQELEEMIEFADRSGDGMLRLKDFIKIARKVNL